MHAPSAMALPPLREELLLHAAPASHDGVPAWTLEDPGRNQFFQIGWAEAEMLSRWHLGDAGQIAQSISQHTTLDIASADVSEFARFLDRSSLTQARGAPVVQRYLRESQAGKNGKLTAQLLKHYLFFRIPLVRPDAFLARTLPWVRRIFLTRRFAMLTLCAGLLGVLLAARQWEQFRHTFLYFFTLEGAALAALTLGATKLLHELGHAYVAKHHGCRVATMGLAFMVLWPVLYTDASGAWRLAARRQRLAIGSAGMLAETALSAWAILAWSFLPEGALRSAAFILATTTWLLTLAVNLNPLMRFDGYFLLSDALNVPNLQQRAFALARWRLREWLFALGDEQPEVFAPWRQRALLAYAYCVWVYRFFLFVGIAVLVYHMTFKVLGIVLFLVEIVAFVLRPMLNELLIWKNRVRTNGWNRRSRITALLLLLVIIAALIPWRTRVEAPALLRARQQAQLVAPVGAQLLHVQARAGQAVAAGTQLFVLQSPELNHELAALAQRIRVLQWQQSFQAMQQAAMAAVPVAQRELLAAQERYAVLLRQQAQLTITAPFAGIVAERSEELVDGEWIGSGEWLATLAAPQQALVEAYVSEADLHRLSLGAEARFLAEDTRLDAVPLKVVEIAAAATRRLNSAPELASPNGGAIAATQEQGREREREQGGRSFVPEQAVYRILLAPPRAAEAALPRLQVLRGTVLIQGAAESFLRSVGRRVMAVFIRETAF
jgi:putative peptide zinc metalloprotease protein